MIIKTTIMVLGELPSFKNLFPDKKKTAATSKSFDRHVPLSKLEVVQLFHVTHMRHRESILTYGLLPVEMPVTTIVGFRTYGPRIYVSTIYSDLPFGYVGNTNLDVWTFFLPSHKLIPDEIQCSGNHYYIEESVPWYKLYLHGTITDIIEKWYELYWGLNTV